MGNTNSAEAPRKSLKTTYKLSKPKTGNHANTNLLGSNGFADSARRLSNTEVLPVRPEFTPLPSPMYAPSEVEAGSSDGVTGFPALESQDQLSRPPLLRSYSSRERLGRHDRRGSTGTIASRQANRTPVRANSMIVGISDWRSYENVHAAGLSRAGSRRSVNYDPTSYESRRLLNLAEEPSYGEGSMISEGQASVTGTVGAGFDQQPYSGAATSLPRAKSDVALYTPMRRRSLLITPGTATRKTAPVAPMPSKPRTRHSLPCTPARRGSLEPLDANSFTIPFSIEDSASIPRSLTPCDSDYKQTGAFKHGTLRITNGSPTRSPAIGSIDKVGNTPTKSQSLGPKTNGDYFGSKRIDNDKIQSSNPNYMVGHAETRRNSFRSHLASRTTHENSLPTIELHAAKWYMSPQSPPLNDACSPLSPKSAQLQVTSKHSAMEDELFELEDEPQEFPTSEVLDVRIDLNAKSLPPRPSLVSEGGSISTDLSRADSGIVASPISEVPPKPLTKADSGYSSNISLRSFSSRRRGRENNPRRDSQPNTQLKTHPGCRTSTEQRNTTNLAALEVQDGVQPPSVPEKDHRRSLEATTGISLSRRNLRLLGSRTKSKASVPEFSNRGEDNADVQTPATVPGSTLSIDITAPKQKRMQRFLSGARRASSSVHATYIHPSEQAGIPPVPQDIETKLHRRSGSHPKFMRTDMLKTERSRDTLGTILSVGSAEASMDGIALIPQSRSETRERASSREDQKPYSNPSANLKDGTLAAHGTTSSTTRHSIPRKPVPRRATSEDVRGHVTSDPAHNSNRNYPHNYSENWRAEGRSSSATESKTRVRPSSTSGGTNPVALSVTSTKSRSVVARDAMKPLTNEPRFPAPAEPPFTTRSPPPVSMNTRSKGHFPSRPKSTPPGTSVAHSGPISQSSSTSVAQGSSHEKLQERSFKRSQSSVFHASSNMLSAHPRIDSRQSAAPKPQTGEDGALNWNIQSGHDVSRSRKSSFDHDGAYSISIRSTPGSSHSSKTNLFPDQPEQIDPHLVRHRSSYDGHTRLHMRTYSRDDDPYLPPKPQMRGHAHTSGPSTGYSTSQQRNEPPRNLPYVSRSHARNPSWGSRDVHGNPLPFRILHSYNSPAYRNAPIWG